MKLISIPRARILSMVNTLFYYFNKLRASYKNPIKRCFNRWTRVRDPKTDESR